MAGMNASGIVLAIGTLLFFSGLFISFSILESGFVPGQSDGPETLSQIETQIIQKLSKEHQAGNICSASQLDVEAITTVIQRTNAVIGRPFVSSTSQAQGEEQKRDDSTAVSQTNNNILEDSLIARMGSLHQHVVKIGENIEPELSLFRETLVSTQTFEENVAQRTKDLHGKIEDQIFRLDRIDSALGQFVSSWEQQTTFLLQSLRDLKELQTCSVAKLKTEINMAREPQRFAASFYPPIPQRLEAVKQAFTFAWDSYKTHCWGKDELKPLSRSCENWSSPPYGLTILDALDTLYIMKLESRFNEAREWVATSLNFDSGTAISVFETTIRALGGLLSAYDLSEDRIFFEKAVDLGRKLMKSFDTFPFSPVVAPITHIRIGSEGVGPRKTYPSQTNLAEAGTLQLEFLRLALLLGDQELAARVLVIWEKIIAEPQAIPGLFPLYMDTSGRTSGGRMTLGGMGDSFYEYLMKIGLFTGNKVQKYRKVYETSVNSIVEHMVFKTQPHNYTYLAELNAPGQPFHVMEHLTCFAGGMFALGARGTSAARDLRLGAEITATCREFYAQMQTGIGPEVMQLNPKTPPVGAGPILGPNGQPLIKDFAPIPRSSHYILRPETLESIFIMSRLTGDPKYRDWAWDIFQAIELHCKTESGYSGIRNVDQVPVQKDDLQQSFLLAETFKYLYLIFSENDVIPLDKYVFNTEAHPFKIQPQLSPDWVDVIENPSKFLESIHKKKQEEIEKAEQEQMRLAEEQRKREEEAIRQQELARQQAIDEPLDPEQEALRENQRIQEEERIRENERLQEEERIRENDRLLQEERRREKERTQEEERRKENQRIFEEEERRKENERIFHEEERRRENERLLEERRAENERLLEEETRREAERTQQEEETRKETERRKEEQARLEEEEQLQREPEAIKEDGQQNNGAHEEN